MQNHIRRFSSSSSSPRLNKWCVITDNHGLSLSFRVNKKKEEEEKKKPPGYRDLIIIFSLCTSVASSSFFLYPHPPTTLRKKADRWIPLHTHTHTHVQYKCTVRSWPVISHGQPKRKKKRGKKKKHLCVRALYTHISVRIDLMSRAFFSLSLPFNTRRCMQESESKAYTSLERNEEKIIIK